MKVKIKKEELFKCGITLNNLDWNEMSDEIILEAELVKKIKYISVLHDEIAREALREGTYDKFLEKYDLEEYKIRKLNIVDELGAYIAVGKGGHHMVIQNKINEIIDHINKN